MGLEKMHPFDAGKWGKVIGFLKEEQLITDDNIVEAQEATEDDLLVVHTRRYLNKLKVIHFPNSSQANGCVFMPHISDPCNATQQGARTDACKLAIDRGWAINVGGGFHHCSSDKGGGFCAYADITLAIKFLFERVEGVSKATIIDLDAHQWLNIFSIYLKSKEAAISFMERFSVVHFLILPKCKQHLAFTRSKITFSFVPLGGVIKRDEILFKAARRRKIPILMVTSGGYQKRTARIIADSIINLHNLGLVDCDSAASEARPSQVPLNE
ncbi:HDA11 deacetylase, partial [Polyodon spathula]|nr:HDA11 deacetylase [Polyodon spathula]